MNTAAVHQEAEKMHEKTAFISLSPIGVFAFSEDKSLLYFELFEKDPEKAIKQFEEGVSQDFLDHLKDYNIEFGLEADKILREKIRDISQDLKFTNSEKEFNEFISKFSYLFSKKKMRFSFSKDKFVIQANNALEDLQKISGVMSERLKEWFTLHYPECKMSQKQLTEYVAQYGSRENFPDFKESVGLEISEEDELTVKSYAETIQRVNEERNKMEKYIRTNITELCPNTSSLIDELLLAKLISSAGSIEKLSRMSSSSIQLLGAEKALFRHLRKKGKSPKYGLIFMSSHIQNAPEENRGKIARIISAKIMQSIRIDFYSGRNEKERLIEELNEEMSKVVGK